jgi:hypothetical protein
MPIGARAGLTAIHIRRTTNVAEAPKVPLRAALIDALRTARAAGRGVSPELEEQVRAYARAQREAGLLIEQVLIEVKGLVRDATGEHEPVFTPKVVGWTVAGYYHGTRRSDAR